MKESHRRGGGSSVFATLAAEACPIGHRTAGNRHNIGCAERLQMQARDIPASMGRSSTASIPRTTYPFEALPMGWAALALSSVANRTKECEALQCDGVGP